jgi:hypothetical protein
MGAVSLKGGSTTNSWEVKMANKTLPLPRGVRVCANCSGPYIDDSFGTLCSEICQVELEAWEEAQYEAYSSRSEAFEDELLDMHYGLYPEWDDRP